MTKIGEDRLAELQKLANILLPPADTAVKLRVITNDISTPRLRTDDKAEILRVKKLPKAQHLPPKHLVINKKTKYSNHHQLHVYNTRSQTNVGMEYTGIPMPKQQPQTPGPAIATRNAKTAQKQNPEDPPPAS